MVLILNWFKSYNTNEKHAKMQKTQKSPKTIHEFVLGFLGLFLTKNAQKQKYLRFV